MCQKQCRDEVGGGDFLVYICFVILCFFCCDFSHVFAIIDRTASSVTACRSPISGSCCWPRRTPTGSWTTSPSRCLLLLPRSLLRDVTTCSTRLLISVFLFPSASSRVTSWSCFGDVLVGSHDEEDVLGCSSTLGKCSKMFENPSAQLFCVSESVQGPSVCTTTLSTMSTLATGSTST